MARALATLPGSGAVKVRPLISPSSEVPAVLFPASPCAESRSASLGPASTLTAPALAPARLVSDPLLAVARSIASTIQRATCLDSFLAVKQQPTLSPPPSAVNYPASPLLKEYSELGCPADVGPAWPLTTIIAAISTGPHASTLIQEAAAFFWKELLERVQNGFRIILPVEVALLLFGDRIRISCLASVDQANRKPRLICNSSVTSDDVTPAVNTCTDKYNARYAMQFGACLSWFLHNIWEADPSDGPVWLSKWYISDAFHQYLLRPGEIGSFTYVVPPLPTDISSLLCIYLVLPMGWFNSPYMFYAAS